jgi:hypothetical protein
VGTISVPSLKGRIAMDNRISTSTAAITPPLHEHAINIGDSHASSSSPQKNSPGGSLSGLQSQGNPIPEPSGSPDRRLGSLPETGQTSGVASPSATTPPVSAELSSIEALSKAERTATLERLQSKIETTANREVNTDVAAQLINSLRLTGPGAHSSGGPAAAATNADLMKGISDDHVKQWYSAQGLSDQDVSALRKSAFLSGLPNPTGSFATNAVQYIAAPFVSLAANTPWAGTGVGIATMLATPAANAFQQSAVVALGESIREHGGPVIANSKESINDKHWLPELSKDLQHQVDQFGALHKEISNILSRYDVSTAADFTPETLKPLQTKEAANDLKELQQHVERLLDTETKLHDTQRNFMMTQGAHDRQWSGNKWQAIPRTLRAPVAGLTGLVSKTGPSDAQSPASAPAPGPSAVATAAAAAGLAAKVLSPTMQTVAAVGMTVGQHLAAGFDEKAKQEYNNKLNLLYGDPFTTGGKEKLARGEQLNGDDIDAKKLRGFTQSREQSLVKHVSAELGRQIKTIKSELTPAADAPAKPLSTEARAALEGQLATLTEDAAKLKAGKLSELSSGGMAETLLIASDKSVLSQQLLQDVKAKYTMKEFSSQTIQRAGQAFHLGVLGSAASSVIGKVVSAASGGASKAPTLQTAGIAALSGAMAYVGATNQHTAISVKNNRRESETDISAGTQLKRGVMGGATEFFAQRSGEKASREMNTMLAEGPVSQTLQFARDLREHLGPVTLPENTSHVMTPDEAAQQLHPGHVTQAGAGHIAIDMESLSPKKSDQAESSAASQERPARDQLASTSDKGKAPMVDEGKSV